MLRIHLDLATNVKEKEKQFTFTKPSDAIEHVASFTLTSVRPQHVEARMTSTDVFSSLTLIDICKQGCKRQRTP